MNRFLAEFYEKGGIIHGNLQDFDESIYYLDESLKIYCKENEKLSRKDFCLIVKKIIMIKIEFFIKLGNFDLIIEHYNVLINICCNKFEKSFYMIKKCEILLKYEKNDTALILVRSIEKNLDNSGMNWLRIQITFNHFDLLFTQLNFSKAKKLYKSVKKILEDENSRAYIRIISSVFNLLSLVANIFGLYKIKELGLSKDIFIKAEEYLVIAKRNFTVVVYKILLLILV